MWGTMWVWGECVGGCGGVRVCMQGCAGVRGWGWECVGVGSVGGMCECVSVWVGGWVWECVCVWEWGGMCVIRANSVLVWSCFLLLFLTKI